MEIIPQLSSAQFSRNTAGTLKFRPALFRAQCRLPGHDPPKRQRRIGNPLPCYNLNLPCLRYLLSTHFHSSSFTPGLTICSFSTRHLTVLNLFVAKSLIPSAFVSLRLSLDP